MRRACVAMLVSGLAAVGPMIGEAQPHGVLPKNDAVWGCTDITNPGCMGPKVAEKGAFILRKKDAYFAPPQDWRHPVAQNDRREKIAGFVIAIAITGCAKPEFVWVTENTNTEVKCGDRVIGHVHGGKLQFQDYYPEGAKPERDPNVVWYRGFFTGKYARLLLIPSRTQ